MLIPFATEMERCQTLQQIRNGTFPAQFLKLFELKTEVSKYLINYDKMIY